MRVTFTSLSLIACALLPMAATAQDAGPYHARSGALLALADEETKIVYAVLIAKVFDVELAKTLLGDLKDVLGDAKSSAFRASQLVEDAKAAPELAKLDEALKAAEASLQKLALDLDRESKNMKVDDDSGDIAPSAGAGADDGAPQPNWDVLKDGVGALHRDLTAARSQHHKLAKTVKPPALKAPPPPKKK